MRAFSNDLRERLVAAAQRAELPQRQLARLFGVSLSCLVRLLQRHRQTGAVQPKPHAGGPAPKLDHHAQQRLRQLVQRQPDATLAELRQRLAIACSLSTIARALDRLELPRKKKTLHADERNTPKVQRQRKAFAQKMAKVDPAHLVFVDEAGATTKLTRTHGRAPRGQRVYASAPGKWQSVTLIVGLRAAGVIAPWAFAGATDQAAFRTYVKEVLVPTLRPGDVVVWDNLKPHKDAEVIRAIEAVGARVEPLPPYSPDQNPIEEMFSKVKSWLRTVAARTVESVMGALGVILNRISARDIFGWFQDRAAYAMP